MTDADNNRVFIEVGLLSWECRCRRRLSINENWGL